jgi:hypothetical protein
LVFEKNANLFSPKIDKIVENSDRNIDPGFWVYLHMYVEEKWFIYLPVHMYVCIMYHQKVAECW